MTGHISRRNFCWGIAGLTAASKLIPYSLANDGSKTLSFVFSDSDPPTSYLENSVSVGIFPDLVKGLFQVIDGYSIAQFSYPWKRAKLMVEHGEADAFCTVPSNATQEYTYFQRAPLYTDDFGYLIYNKDNPRAKGIEKVKSFEDLRSYRLMTDGKGSGWEFDNIPSYIKRVYAPTNDILLTQFVKRNVGEFFLKSIYEARYQVGLKGFGDKLGYVKLNFIPNSKLPFHIGISKQRPDAKKIIGLVDDATNSPQFKLRSAQILSRYS
ncbi:MAG: hypothetical protein V7776_11045 [Halopseudomonas aestusnigri]